MGSHTLSLISLHAALPALPARSLHVLNSFLQSVKPSAYASSHFVWAASYASLSTTHGGGGGVGEDEGGGVGDAEGGGGDGDAEGGGSVGDAERVDARSAIRTAT